MSGCVRSVVLALALGGWCVAGAAAQAPPEPASFHHVHLNVADPQKTIEFYQRVFGAVLVKFQGVADALFTERSFILMNKVSRPAPAELTTAIWHIGWGGVDLPNEFNWWKAKGVEFHKPITKLGETNYYMYLYGPDREVVEIYSGEQNHRYNHVHLFATDVNATAQWYADHLGIPLRRRDIPKPADPTARWANAFRVDNVTINVFAKPDTDPPPSWWSDKPLKTLEPTRGRVIDHIAFSYRRIEPVFERMKKAGIQIVEPIAVREDSGLKSFFVLGPDNVLIEIVEAKPIPDASWDK
jgi:catechol 2,3-dioxygenase-like lactoylglutathione lyase family enzyme